MKINKLIIGGFLLLLFAAPVFAVLQVNFNEGFNVGEINNRVDYFWKVDPNNADQSGRLINTSPNTDFDNFADVNKQAKVGNISQTSIVYFGADEGYPDTGIISIRVWEDPSKTSYTTLKSFTNSTGGTVEDDFGDQDYVFTKAFPAPEIYKIDMSTVKEGESETTELKFYSKGNKVEGKDVEIKSRAWSVKYNGADVGVEKLTGAASSTLVLSSAKGNVFNPGDTYEATVTYTNLWDEAASDSEEYTIVALPGAAQIQAFTFTSMVVDDQPGINNFSIPFGPDPGGEWHAYRPGVSETVYSFDESGPFISAVNSIAGKNVVSSFGVWDKAAQQALGVMISYKSADLNDFSEQSLADYAASKDIVKNFTLGQSYQIYVSEDVLVTITNQTPDVPGGD